MELTEHKNAELERLQQWMQAVVTDSNYLSKKTISEAEKIVAPSSALSAGQRITIYTRSYQARLIQCFQTMFPTLFHALGEDIFNHFAIDYLEHYPPTSYTLDRLADSFPKYLSETRPDAEDPQTNESETWPQFIIDLATFELTLLKIFDGVGVEDKTISIASDVLALSDKELSNASLIKVPCLCLFAFSYPVQDYWRDVREGNIPELPEPRETFLVMSRRNYRVKWYELSRLQYDFLSADGEIKIDESLDIKTTREWICDWADKGFIERIETKN